MKIKLQSLIIILVSFFISCQSGETDKKKVTEPTEKIEKEEVAEDPLSIKIDLQVNAEAPIKCGQMVDIYCKVLDSAIIDSIKLFVNKNLLQKYTDAEFTHNFDTKSEAVGLKNIEIIVYSEAKSKTFYSDFVLLSDIVPQQKGYKVLAEYPHDVNAYTQGLVFDDNVLYEATGLETKSSIRKVDLQKGEILFSKNNPNDVFGEGITIFNDNLIQITWQDQIGYVYDKETFQILSEFSYSTEGWGLTNDDNYLYLSDGTNIIYVFDPTTFVVVKQIQVYDNEKEVFLLNELEYIDGYIYANVYTKDYIVKIDIETGKVIEKIDLSGLLPQALINEKTDVLNGIAFDKKENRIFVTGKNWPKLYQVKFE